MRDRPSNPRDALHAALAATVAVAGNDAAGFEARVDAVLDHLAGDGWELVDTTVDHESELLAATAAAAEAQPRRQFRAVPEPGPVVDLMAELEASIAAAREGRRRRQGSAS